MQDLTALQQAAITVCVIVAFLAIATGSFCATAVQSGLVSPETARQWIRRVAYIYPGIAVAAWVLTQGTAPGSAVLPGSVLLLVIMTAAYVYVARAVPAQR